MRNSIFIWLSIILINCSCKKQERQDIKNTQFQNACFNLEVLNRNCNTYVCVSNHSKDTSITVFKNTSFSYELYSFENYRGFNILTISANVNNKNDTLEACICREIGQRFDTFIFFEHGEKAIVRTFSIFDKYYPIDKYHTMVEKGTWLQSKAYQYFLKDNLEFYQKEKMFQMGNVAK